MKILIDADACPVIDISIKIATLYKLNVLIICDTSHLIKKDNAETIVSSKGNDSVDFVLINKVNKGDIVITQDYGLATMVISKGGFAINQNGLIYDDNNIDKLLFFRHISKEIRKKGGKTKGPKKRKKEDDLNFEQNLINLICSKV